MSLAMSTTSAERSVARPTTLAMVAVVCGSSARQSALIEFESALRVVEMDISAVDGVHHLSTILLGTCRPC
jgi:hypothetical protein